MAITNSGLPFEMIEPGLKYGESMCHSCKTTYKILWQ